MPFDASTAEPLVADQGFNAESAVLETEGFDPSSAELVKPGKTPSNPFALNEEEFRAATPWGRLKMMLSHPWDKYVASVDQGFKGVEIPRVEAEKGAGIDKRIEQGAAAATNVAAGAVGGAISPGGALALAQPQTILYSIPRFVVGGIEDIIDAYKGAKGGADFQETAEKGLGGALMVGGAALGAKQGLADARFPKTPQEAIAKIKEEAANVEDPQAKAALEAAAVKISDNASKGVKFDAESAVPVAEIPVEPVAPIEAVATPEPKADIPTSEKLTGIKNAAVDAEMEMMGKEPTTHGQKLTMQAALDEAVATAAKDPEAGRRLVTDLADNPRPVTGREDALLTHELNRLALERDAADAALGEAVKAADAEAIKAAQDRVTQAQDTYQRTAEVSTQVGTENAQGLALRKMMLKRDYSLAAMEQRVRSELGGEKLPEAVTEQIKALNEKIVATQKAFDEYVASRERQDASRPRHRPPNRIVAALGEQAKSARERIRARMAEGRQMSGLDPADLVDHAIIGAEYIAKGVDDLAGWSKAMIDDLGEAIRPHLEAIFEEAKKVHSNERRLESLKDRLEKRTEDLQGRLETGNIEPKPKPDPIHLDEEANQLQAEYEKAKAEFDAFKDKMIYESKTPFQKVTTGAADLYDTARLLMTTGEFSFVLRQGKVAALSHPIMTMRALPDTFRALAADPVAAHAINLKVLNHPDIGLAKSAKLHVLDESASLTKQEEALMGRLVGKIPLIKRFNQAGIVFMNRIRFDMFQQMRQSSGGLNAMERRQLATFINEATGRGGLGKFEPAAVNLARVMFAPRYLASRIQLATGHSLWGGSAATRRIIAKEYAKTLIGLGLYYSALKMGLSTDDKPAEIGTDPRSSDFGKVKIGNTRLDPLAGVSQVAVLGARTATGETMNSRGKVTPIRGPYVPFGGDRWSDVAARFARSKLHPVPASVINLFDGTDLSGQKADITNQALNMAAPLTYMDIYQALEEQDLPQGVALALLAMLGEGLQTYKAGQNKVTAPSAQSAPASR